MPLPQVRELFKLTATGSIKALIRFDDQCSNGHCTFSITGEIYNKCGRLESCCCHEELGRAFPELRPLFKWHLCSTDGPMHYIANTLYWVMEKNLERARSAAIWPEAKDWELQSMFLPTLLESRLPKLLEDFQAAVESAGLKYDWPAAAAA